MKFTRDQLQTVRLDSEAGGLQVPDWSVDSCAGGGEARLDRQDTGPGADTEPQVQRDRQGHPQCSCEGVYQPGVW